MKSQDITVDHTKLLIEPVDCGLFWIERVFYMVKCKKWMEWTIFHDVCMYMALRAQTIINSKMPPPEKSVDCDITECLYILTHIPLNGGHV